MSDKIAVIRADKAISDIEEIQNNVENLISIVKFLESKGLKIEIKIQTK